MPAPPLKARSGAFRTPTTERLRTGCTGCDRSVVGARGADYRLDTGHAGVHNELCHGGRSGGGGRSSLSAGTDWRPRQWQAGGRVEAVEVRAEELKDGAVRLQLSSENESHSIFVWLIGQAGG